MISWATLGFARGLAGRGKTYLRIQLGIVCWPTPHQTQSPGQIHYSSWMENQHLYHSWGCKRLNLLLIHGYTPYNSGGIKSVRGDHFSKTWLVWGIQRRSLRVVELDTNMDGFYYFEKYWRYLILEFTCSKIPNNDDTKCV